MKNYPFNFETLHEFSNEILYVNFSSEENCLFEELIEKKAELNFPAIENNIGQFISFMCSLWKPQTIFEMGSGYGHSAFWFLRENPFLKNIILTEKRSDLEIVFNDLSWPVEWRNKIDYFQGDAFEKIKEVDNIDLCLIDGVKADYLKFLKVVQTKIKDDGVVLIDNSFWRGSFLDDEIVTKKESAKKIRELHCFLKETNDWEAVFVPYVDGLCILKKKSKV